MHPPGTPEKEGSIRDDRITPTSQSAVSIGLSCKAADIREQRIQGGQTELQRPGGHEAEEYFGTQDLKILN